MAGSPYTVWSTAYLADAGATANTGMCYGNIGTWREAHDEQADATRLIALITAGSRTLYCPLGNPVDDSDLRGGAGAALPHIYLSYEHLEKLGLEGSGEQAEVTWLSQEAFPEATRIVLRPHDSAFYHANAKEELERELTRRGVLCEGDTILLRLEELGGYEMAFDVVKTEPANVVLAEGEEVAIEFEEALDAAAARPPTPCPTEEAPPFFPELATMLPSSVTEGGAGTRLGGEPAKRLADGRPWNPWREGGRQG